MFLAQRLILLGEESLTLQTVTAYLKWDQKENVAQLRWMNYTTCYSECLIMALHYAPVYSKIKNYYFFYFFFLRDILFFFLM